MSEPRTAAGRALLFRIRNTFTPYVPKGWMDDAGLRLGKILAADILAIELGTDSLNAAWAEAEAALPDRHGGLHIQSRGDWGRIDSWDAYTYRARGATVAANGPTPAAALRALAAKLREAGVSAPTAQSPAAKMMEKG